MKPSALGATGYALHWLNSLFELRAGHNTNAECPGLRSEIRKPADVNEGLLVENVDSGPAARAGIQPGDIILSVNGEKTASIRQLKSLIASDAKQVALLILRGDQKMFAPVKIG